MIKFNYEISIKIETQKIVNISNATDNNTELGAEDKDGSSIKFETKGIKPSLCNYSDAYLTGDITARVDNAVTNIGFKNLALFTRCVTYMNNEHIDTTENFGIIMPINNLNEYSENYSNTSGSLWQFKRDKSSTNNAGNPDNVSTDNSSSFKYKSSILK